MRKTCSWLSHPKGDYKTMNYKHLLIAGLSLGLAISAAAQSGPKTDAEKSFDTMKTLAGTWTGQVRTSPPQADIEGKVMQASLRVTSMGNAIVHEMTGEGRPDDPITMVYLDGDRLILTHYCDAGNRPRMVGKELADGKAVDFNFLDVSGSTAYGHMDHAVFTVLDANHHNEDWTYMEPGDKPIHVHLELTRTK
jgi:hypothetical protein